MMGLGTLFKWEGYGTICPVVNSSLENIILNLLWVLFVQSSLGRRIDSHCVVAQESNFVERV